MENDMKCETCQTVTDPIYEPDSDEYFFVTCPSCERIYSVGQCWEPDRAYMAGIDYACGYYD